MPLSLRDLEEFMEKKYEGPLMKGDVISLYSSLQHKMPSWYGEVIADGTHHGSVRFHYLVPSTQKHRVILQPWGQREKQSKKIVCCKMNDEFEPVPSSTGQKRCSSTGTHIFKPQKESVWYCTHLDCLGDDQDQLPPGRLCQVLEVHESGAVDVAWLQPVVTSEALGVATRVNQDLRLYQVVPLPTPPHGGTFPFSHLWCKIPHVELEKLEVYVAERDKGRPQAVMVANPDTPEKRTLRPRTWQPYNEDIDSSSDLEGDLLRGGPVPPVAGQCERGVLPMTDRNHLKDSDNPSGQQSDRDLPAYVHLAGPDRWEGAAVGTSAPAESVTIIDLLGDDDTECDSGNTACLREGNDRGVGGRCEEQQGGPERGPHHHQGAGPSAPGTMHCRYLLLDAPTLVDEDITTQDDDDNEDHHDRPPRPKKTRQASAPGDGSNLDLYHKRYHKLSEQQKRLIDSCRAPLKWEAQPGGLGLEVAKQDQGTGRVTIFGLQRYTRLQSLQGEKLTRLEAQVQDIAVAVHAGHLQAPHATICEASKRTKVFFGCRYEVCASGKAPVVIFDVPPLPPWLTHLAAELQQEVPGVFLDALPQMAVINIYHGRGSSLHAHVDRHEIFARPILTVRLLADGAIRFGYKMAYGGAPQVQADEHKEHIEDGGLDPRFEHCVALPRGSLLVMQGMAADRLKHRVAACDVQDMTASIIFRWLTPEA